MAADPSGSVRPGVGVSVIMVVYRTGPALKGSIDRVLTDPLTDQFVIIDNGSSAEEEGWIDAAAAADKRVTVIRGHGNVGFARGANMGANAASSAVLVFLNPDAFLQAGCLQSLAEGVRIGPSPCLVGARVLNPDLSEQRGARRGEVTPVTTLLSLLRLSHRFSFLRRFEIHHEGDPAPCGRVPVPTISGAGFAMTREDFAGLKGFDEGYFLHVEDVDLCWRVRQAGGSVWFDPNASIIHLGSTSRTSPIKIEFWKGVGLVRYFRKRADNPVRVLVANLLAPAIILASLARALLRKRRPR
jgi:N-acetylglucosaminyl-diphospho-decaprenol L-rhamnosyltransferase